MKKFFAFAACCAVLAALCAFGAAPSYAAGKEIVVYFSATGTTREAAETLAKLRGADVWEIVPEQPYTADDLNYRDDASRSNSEQRDGASRPAIAGGVRSLDEYDVVFVGYPIWWGNMPRIMYTFFDGCVLSGKTIAPFCTSGGSGVSASVSTIKELEPQAKVTEGLRVRNGERDFAAWLEETGLAK